MSKNGYWHEKDIILFLNHQKPLLSQSVAELEFYEKSLKLSTTAFYEYWNLNYFNCE